MISLASKNGILPIEEADARTCFIKKLLLIIAISQESTFVGVFFFKVASLTLLKKTPTQVVFCKFCNILNSTSLVKQIRTAPFEHSQHHKVSDTMLRKQEFLWLILNFHKENYWKKNQPRKQFLAHSNQQKSQKRCDICSKLTIKTAERRHINDVVLMSLLLTVNIFHTFFVVFLLSSLNK